MFGVDLVKIVSVVWTHEMDGYGNFLEKINSRDPKLDVSNVNSKSPYLYEHYTFSIGLLYFFIVSSTLGPWVV